MCVYSNTTFFTSLVSAVFKLSVETFMSSQLCLCSVVVSSFANALEDLKFSFTLGQNFSWTICHWCQPRLKKCVWDFLLENKDKEDSADLPTSHCCGLEMWRHKHSSMQMSRTKFRMYSSPAEIILQGILSLKSRRRPVPLNTYLINFQELGIKKTSCDSYKTVYDKMST